MDESIITQFDEETGEWEIADTEDDDAVMDRILAAQESNA